MKKIKQNLKKKKESKKKIFEFVKIFSISFLISAVAVFTFAGIYFLFFFDNSCSQNTLEGTYYGAEPNLRVNGVWTTDLQRLKDYKGNYICINSDLKDLRKVEETCRHELGHEIFARYCQKGIKEFNNCVEAMELDDYLIIDGTLHMINESGLRDSDLDESIDLKIIRSLE